MDKKSSSPKRIPKDMSLPSFRSDLKLYRGPNAEDGSPTYSLYDPVAAKYYQIAWRESLIFQLLRPGMTASELKVAIEAKAPLKVSLQELALFFRDAEQHHLLTGVPSSEKMIAEAEAKHVSWLKWLLYHYLYIRIPIINPDEFLDRTLRYVRPLFSWPAILLYTVMIFAGVVQLLGRFQEYLHTFPYFFSWGGLLTYAIALSAIKVIHEFSHAYTAKNYGVHVPTMGVAFLVLWPVLYTDVTDSWKLYRRRHRIAITSAGVIAELVIAGLATLGWALSSAGAVQSAFFVVSSVTWISTLAVNLNPAMRFDGYYLLSDLWGVDNLHSRSFSMARWQLRKWLLGLDVPPPETDVSRARVLGMVLFSLYTWIYRLFLYTAIAVFVYLKFTKSLGIFLFIVEVYVFLIAPFVSETRQLWILRRYIKANLRMRTTAVVVGLLVAWFVLPLPHKMQFAAVTIPAERQVLYVPYDSTVTTIEIARGDTVAAEQPLVALQSQQLDNDIAISRAEIDILQKQIFILGKSDADRPFLPEHYAQLAAEEAKLAGLLELQRQLKINAQLDGSIYRWDELIIPGQFVSKDQILGEVAQLNTLEVVCYIPETDINSVEVGDRATFALHSPRRTFNGTVVQVQPARSKLLRYPQLASEYGGELAVIQETANKLKLVDSYYEVRIRFDEKRPIQFGQTGKIEIRGPWRSKLMTLFRYVTSVLWRESGF